MSFPRLRALARLIGSRLPIADRAGSVAVISAIVFSVLVGFAGLAIDATSWEETHVRAQTAADQAAISAGAASLQGASLQAYTTDARGVAAANGFVNGTNGATVTVYSTPQSGPYAGDTGDVEVIVQQQGNSYFSRQFLASAPIISAHAVVSANYGACIIVLGTTGTTFSMNGAMSTTLSSCDFYNNSSSSSGTYLNGAVSLSAEDIYLTGNYHACGVTCTVKATNSLVTGAAPVKDPYLGRTPPFPVGQSIPSADCSYKNETLSGAGTFNFTDTPSSSPTVFCGGLTAKSIAGSISFGSGTYVFDGDVNISGAVNITSSDATLVVTPGHSLSISGAANLQLTAPTTGSTSGIAIWIEQDTSTSPVTSGSIGLTGASSVNITGAVYAPGGALTINGASGSQCTQLVASSISVTGAASLQHNCTGLGISDVGGIALIE